MFFFPFGFELEIVYLMYTVCFATAIFWGKGMNIVRCSIQEKEEGRINLTWEPETETSARFLHYAFYTKLRGIDTEWCMSSWISNSK